MKRKWLLPAILSLSLITCMLPTGCKPASPPQGEDNSPELSQPSDGEDNTQDTQKEYTLSVTEKELLLIAGDEAAQSGTLTVEAKADGEADSAPQITYTVSDPTVISVSETGTVSALKRGNAEVTATYHDQAATVSVRVYEDATKEEVNSFDERYVNRYGRQYMLSRSLVIDHVSSALEVAFYGTSLTGSITAVENVYLHVFVDGKDVSGFVKATTSESFTFASSLKEGIHTARIVKASEVDTGSLRINSISAERFLAVPENEGLKMEFIGDSITVGYGDLGGTTYSVDNTDSTKSFAYLTAEALNANYSVVAYSGICVKASLYFPLNMVEMHAYVSPRTKVPFTAYDSNMDVVVLGLGTNDSGYIRTHINYKSQFAEDYKSFLEHLRSIYPNAHIVCVYGMMGIDDLAEAGIRSAITQLADEKITYKTFKSNTLGASGHPNDIGQRNFSKQLTTYIEEILG